MFEESAEPGESGRDRVFVDGCREITSDDEVRALAATDLVGDHAADDVGVFVIGDVEACAVERHGGGRQCTERLLEREVGVLIDDETPQRGVVVVALESALDDLAERYKGKHFARGADGIRQRNVGQQSDVDDSAGEDLHRRAVARDQGERATGAPERVQVSGARDHRRAFRIIGRAIVAGTKRPPQRAVCLFERTHRFSGWATTMRVRTCGHISTRRRRRSGAGSRHPLR